MVFTVYRPFTNSSQTFPERLVTGFVTAEKYECRKSWQGIGSFSLTVPADTPGIQSVTADMILYADDKSVSDCLIINAVDKDEHHVTLKGTDMKEMLRYRVTLFPQAEIEAGTYGYDARQGSTGTILAGYINYNCIDPTDTNRKIHGLNIGAISGGRSNDTYMSRLQPISDVAIKMCENADVGWDITFAPSAVDGGYSFRLVEGVDRTNATGQNKCVFAEKLGNVAKVTGSINTSERRTVVWTVNGGDDEKAVVTAIYKSSVSGFDRREAVMTASCDLDLTESYVKSNSADMTDKTQLEFQLIDPEMYGKVFFVGDKVSVIESGQVKDMRVIEVNKSYSGNERNVSVKLGDIPVKKPFERVAVNLAKRSDDVKELALETASVKNKQYATYYTPYDPADTSLQANDGITVYPGDYWAKLKSSSDDTIIARYRRDRQENEVNGQTQTVDVWTRVCEYSEGGASTVINYAIVVQQEDVV